MNWIDSCWPRALFARPGLYLELGPFVEQGGLPFKGRGRPARRQYFGPPREIIMDVTMTDSQQVALTVRAKDKVGNPTTVQPGSVQWFVDNTDLLDLHDNNDGTALLKAKGPLGSGTVSVKATVGGVDVAGVSPVTITSGAPTQIEIDAGTPTEQ